MNRIAVVADIHLHDLHGGYGLIDAAGTALALRTFKDTIASTRVFNESHAALLAILDDIVRRGILDVVLIGDYSDDGQPAAVAALKHILSDYERRHGLRFFVTFGNHDCFGPLPRDQAKRLTIHDNPKPVLVTMHGMSTAEAMAAMADYGIARPDNVLHWETPFGDPAPLVARFPPGGDPAQLDASYLVEPQPGLWLLMLDANVFSKVDGQWQLKADAAWDHVLAERPYLIEWIADVARRADQSGKTLIAFSHYPALPLPFSGDGVDARAISAETWRARMPSPKSGHRLAEAGLKLHFSGHMHVSQKVTLGGLTNIAVPSPVAWPGGYVVVETVDDIVTIETVPMPETRGFDVAFPAYAAETGSNGHAMLAATTYVGFLEAHVQHLIAKRAATPEHRGAPNQETSNSSPTPTGISSRNAMAD